MCISGYINTTEMFSSPTKHPVDPFRFSNRIETFLRNKVGKKNLLRINLYMGLKCVILVNVTQVRNEELSPAFYFIFFYEWEIVSSNNNKSDSFVYMYYVHI